MTSNDLVRTAPVQQRRLPDLQPYLGPAKAVEAAGSIDWERVIPADMAYLRGRALSEFDRTRLLQQHEARPPLAVLHDLIRALEPATATAVDRQVTATAVALMYDSRARQADGGPVYVATLIADLIDMEFPSAAVVAACQELRRTSRFVPEIAEVIEACERHSKRYAASLRLAHRALERWDTIAELLLTDQQRRAASTDPVEE